MKAWLKKNWIPLIAVTIFISGITYGVINTVADINYRSQMRKLNKSIAEKEKKIKESEARVDELLKDIAELDESIAEHDKAIKEKDAEIAAIRKERNDWKGKVENMPPTQIVIETRIQLACDEVWERPDGVLFSLACARTNLQILGDFSLSVKEIEKLNGKIEEMTAEDLKKEMKIKKLDGIILEKDTQIADERGVSADWKGKFDNSEGRRKKARKKGRKEGAVIGGILGGLIGFFLGK